MKLRLEKILTVPAFPRKIKSRMLALIFSFWRVRKLGLNWVNTFMTLMLLPCLVELGVISFLLSLKQSTSLFSLGNHPKPVNATVCEITGACMKKKSYSEKLINCIPALKRTSLSSSLLPDGVSEWPLSKELSS